MEKAVVEFPASVDFAKFLSTHSHDIKTPFNHMIGFTKLILKGQDGPITDFMRDDLTTVFNASTRTLDVFSSMVEMARISTGEKESTFAEIEYAPQFEPAIEHWKKNNAARQAEFETQIETATLVIDPSQMRQVIARSIAFVAELVEGPIKFSVNVAKDSAWVITTIQSTGKKSRGPSALDLEINGFISRAYILQNKGEVRKVQETDDGAIVQFALPLT
jgi:K+-sensing histidine kinase KdpD